VVERGQPKNLENLAKRVTVVAPLSHTAEKRTINGACGRYPQADQGAGRHLAISLPVPYDEGVRARELAPW
jgi:hypothetical protein